MSKHLEPFIQRIANVTRKLPFAVLVHNESTGGAVSIRKGDVVPIKMPPAVAARLKKPKEYCSYFNTPRGVIVLYFLHFKVSDSKYIVVLQDTQKHIRLNRFVSALYSSAHVRDEYGADSVLEEDHLQVAELEMLLKGREEQIASLEKEITELKQAQNGVEPDGDEDVEDIYEGDEGGEEGEHDSVVSKDVFDKAIKKKNKEIARLKEKLAGSKDDLEEELSFLQEQNDDLLVQLERSKKSAAGLKSQIGELGGIIPDIDDSLYESGGELLAENQRLRDVNKKLKGETRDLQDTNKDLQDHVEDLDKRLADAKGRERDLAKREEELAERRKTIEQDKKEAPDVAAIRAEYDALQLKLEARERDVEEASKKTAELELQVDLLDKKLAHVADMAEDIDGNNADAKLLQKVELLETDKKILQDKLAKAVINMKAMETATAKRLENYMLKSEHEEDLVHYRQQIAERDKSINELNQQIKDIHKSHVSSEEYVKAQNETKDWQNQHDVATKEIESLNKDKVALAEEIKGYHVTIEQLKQDIEGKDGIISAASDNVDAMNKLSNEQLKSIDDLKLVIEDAKRETEKAREDTLAIHRIIDSFREPIVTVLEGFNIDISNTAAQVFCGQSGDLAGKCHKVLYGFEARCKWCLYQDVVESKEPKSATVQVNSFGAERTYELVFSPILDNGQLVSVVEYMHDNSNVVALNANMKGLREQLITFRTEHGKNLKNIEDLKETNRKLSQNLASASDRNAKMLKIVEKLVSEDKANELLRLRAEVVDVRNKYIRSNEVIKNYRSQLEEQKDRYANLNKRSFMSMERVLNSIRDKATINNDETFSMLSFLTKEFGVIKKYFINEDTIGMLRSIKGGKVKDVEVLIETEVKGKEMPSKVSQ
ncbi:hypothetical protein RsTz2092_03010 [Deferribacterales bacterium RsTz2092]|nr:hypothetical protein AGMMS49941_07930 [Deferribacterales bacterium]